MIDLRSDTVTRPTEAMRAAMAGAEVGDDLDVLGVDLAAEAAADLVDRRARPLGRRLGARPEQDVPVPCRGGREAAGDGAAAGDPDLLVHGAEPY